MKEVTEAALEHILMAHPHAVVENREGGKVVRIPMYDVNTDRSWWEERRVKPDPEGTARFKPGDVLHHTKTGSPFSIVDPFKAFLKLRRGRNTEE